MTPRQKVLLSFIGAGGEVDPIRIMKGQFLFAMETPAEWASGESRYEFVPYQFGPCSFEIYSDLDELEKAGYLKTRQVPSQSWKYYSATDKGQAQLPIFEAEFAPQAVLYLRRLRTFIDGLSFRKLLEVVYSKYPAFAAKSVFKL